MKPIFEYYDYRLYLKDVFEEKKQQYSFFSYRFLGQKVGIDSSALLRILQGSLHLSNKKIPNLLKYLKLNTKEGLYFENLVYFCKAKSDSQRKIFFEKLLDLTDSPASKIVRKNYKFFQKWYHGVVWSAINIFKFKDNFDDLADFIIPRLDNTEIKNSIELLESLKLITKDSKGFYQTTSQNLTTGKEWYSMAIESYQKEMLELSIKAMNNIDRELSDFSTLTINYHSEMLPELKEILNSCRQTITKLSNNIPQGNQVMQLNIQLFPVSEIKNDI